MSIPAEKLAFFRSQVIGIVDGLVNDPSWRNSQALPVSEGHCRQLYQQGRINDANLSAAFDELADLQAKQPVCSIGGSIGGRIITRGDIYRIALLFDMSAVNAGPLAWWRDEMSAFSKMQPDLPDPVRQKLLADAKESDVIQDLWMALLGILDLPDDASEYIAPSMSGSNTEPENTGLGCAPFNLRNVAATDLPKSWLDGNDVHNALRHLAGAELDRLLALLGVTLSLRDLLRSLSGVDILEAINQQLQRIDGLQVDAGVSAWSTAAHQNPGLYGLWRTLAGHDAGLFLHQLPDWQNIITELPEDAVSTIILQLQRFDIPPSQWQAYLHRLALESPHWLQAHHPSRHAPTPALADLLAIRLTLDRLWLNQVCHELWKIEAKISSLQAYFRKNLSEFWVRLQLYQGNLPEHLTQQAEALIIRSGSERQCRTDWQHLADMALLVQFQPCTQPTRQSQENNSGWRLFRLFQHLGCDAGHVQTLDKTDLHALLSVLDGFNLTERQKIWRHAVWHHDQEATLASSHSEQETTGAKSGVKPLFGLLDRGENPTDASGRLAHPASHRFNLDNRFGDSLRGSLLLAYLWVFISAPLLLGNILIKTFLPQLHRRLHSTSN
ncbi:MAG: Na-translocating system protein MpsB [Methylovulum sp.]|uniref:putative inorganic carbon transporter subunit DabA n=1 Tax=Methylovulum sp. TaxID=1916980 RepID=UPI002624B130|nr:putative inorganic carbon transporter subunit DabA [Methylovulum sp.]MDD2723190.1 Na-translocating system protein MpsB [Methylovulum sp.]MDD5123131.1 Na-translocating system protein MpsB [Methylovulum sp.]